MVTSYSFLWKKFQNNAIFRRADTNKWYAAILTVKKKKLGIDSDGEIEIIDLRGKPIDIIQIVDGKKYLPGYHMNKNNWFTICFDGSVSTKEICNLIDESYVLANK